MEIIFKKATQSDFVRLNEMQQEAFSLNFSMLAQQDKKIVLSSPFELRKKYANMEFFKLIDNGEILGGAYVRKINETTCEIYRIFIDKEKQRQGFGKKIINGIFDNFLECTQFVLVTPIALINNVLFYESCGFVKDGIKKDGDLELQILKKVIVRTATTGLKPSNGGLHLGHWVGNIEPLLRHQNNYKCSFILADLQVRNSNRDYFIPEYLHKNMHLMLKQIFALGVDPHKVVVIKESRYKQAMLENFIWLSDFISNNRIYRLPFIKHIMQTEKSLKMSVMMYPILQALDFIITNPDIVFSNIDNKACIEFINDLFRKISNAGYNIPKPVKLITGKVEMLVGTNGKKMSKTNGNCIFFNDTNEDIRRKVNSMYTDCARVSPLVPGNLENNIVFKYLEVFSPQNEFVDLSDKYKCGKISDKETKEILITLIINMLDKYRDAFESIDDKEIDCYLQ